MFVKKHAEICFMKNHALCELSHFTNLNYIRMVEKNVFHTMLLQLYVEFYSDLTEFIYSATSLYIIGKCYIVIISHRFGMVN